MWPAEGVPKLAASEPGTHGRDEGGEATDAGHSKGTHSPLSPQQSRSKLSRSQSAPPDKPRALSRTRGGRPEV